MFKVKILKNDIFISENRLAFISFFFFKECAYIFVLGDLNDDISDDGSLFGRHLNQFCVNNKLALISKVMLPANSYTCTTLVKHGIQHPDWIVGFVQPMLMIALWRLRSCLVWPQQITYHP